jgi:hypothetical protein
VPTDGQVLTWQTSAGKWHPANIAFPSLALSALSDVSFTEGVGIDGKALIWNNSTSKWEAQVVLRTNPNLLALPDVNTTGALNNWLLAYNTTGPGVHFVNPTSLITVSSLSQVGDVGYPGGGAGAISTGAYLQWNGAAWVPSSSAVTITVASLSDGPGAFTGNTKKGVRVNAAETALEYHAFTLTDLADVNVTEGSGINGFFLKWDNATSKWIAAAGSGGATTLAALTDVTVTEGSGINGYVLYWNNGASKWQAEAIATVATSGAYADLTGLPTLHSTLVGLTDVNITTGSGVNGYSVTWNNGTGKFVLTNVSGGSSALSGLSDVVITSPANTEVLTYDSATSKWKNAAATGGGGSGAGPGGTMTPPLVSSLVAVTNLDSATLTDRTSGVFIPGMHIQPGAGSVDARLSCALQAAPAGNMSVVARIVDTQYDHAGGWHGAGLVMHNSSGTLSAFHTRITGNNPVAYLMKWSGGFGSGTFSLGGGETVGDLFQHMDFDGTNIKLGLSRNGLDIVWFYTEALSAFLGAITHVGVGWAGASTSTNGPEYDVQHFHAGALGTNGL